jgi:hypothetical protein
MAEDDDGSFDADLSIVIPLICQQPQSVPLFSQARILNFEKELSPQRL